MFLSRSTGDAQSVDSERKGAHACYHQMTILGPCVDMIRSPSPAVHSLYGFK